VTNTVNGVVDLTIDKSHTGNFTRGTNQTYSLVVSNAGSAATNANVTVTDVLPAGLSFVSGTGTGWNACTASAQTVTCVRPQANTIAAGTPAPAITLTVGVAANAAASITNTASVAGGGDANNTNNSDSDPTSTEAAGPTKLAFTTAAFSRTVNVCSPLITVQTQNAANAPTNPTTNTTVNLSSSSVGGTFYSDAACSGGNVITSVTILTTGNTGSFYYKDSNAGSPILTAAATGLTPATQTETITAVPNVAPVVDAGGPYSGAEGSAIALNQATATDADGDALTYKWTYVAVGTVDGGTSCGFSNDAILQPTFTCNDDGAFTLTLEVGDGHGHTVSDNATVTVGNADPTATFNTPAAEVNEGSSFALSLTGATDASSNDVATGLRFAFDCGAGYSATNYAGASTTASTSCTTATDGPATLSVKGKVFDNDGGFTEYTGSVTVHNVPPTADAGGPYSGDEGSAIALNGSGDDVSAADKATLTFAWSVDFTGIDTGGKCLFHDPAHPTNAGTATSTLEDPTIVCDDDSKAGTFTATLHVSDDDGGTSSASNAALTVKNVDPVADAGGPYNGNEGDDIQLHGDATDVGAHDTFEWAWEYTAGPGDLDPGASCQFSDATAQEPTIKCTDDGKVKLTLTVHDDNGGMSSADATLTLANLPPVAAAGGPYTGYEGSAIQLNGSANDPGDNDDPYLTYKWTVAYTPTVIDGGGTCTFDDDTKKDAKITCTDDSNAGTFTLSLVAKDDNGGTSVASTAVLTVTNANPIATAGGPYSGNEGAAIQLSGSGDDPGNNDDAGLTYLWTVNGGVCSFDNATNKNAKVTCTDNGIFTLTLAVSDDDAGTGTNTANLTVANLPPTITSLNVSPTVVQIGGIVTLSAQFTDPGHSDTHTASIDWEGATSPGVVTEANGSGSVSATHTYTAAGIYTVSLTVTDDDHDADTETFTQYIVIYDPSAGFVTGGGWINSPAGAYVADASLVGKANFGFVSKYIAQKDKTTPLLTGNTEFQFQAGSLNFSSTVYDWMVVSGSSKASYKGSGTVNGAPGYAFLLSVVDGGSTGDKFRMKIWNKATSAIVYDNQTSAADDATASQLIAGGSIVIHTNGGLANK
jgi:uncharacterized repeat protein (TIGR01451 family)